MKTDDLKNWLAVLGIGGGIALSGPQVTLAAADQPEAGPAHEPPGATRERQPLYVVINHEEQYSIWPARQALPSQWRRVSEPVELGSAVSRFRGDKALRYRVVINHEEQYSIWPQDRKPPEGFRIVPALVREEPCQIEACGKLVERLRNQKR